MTEQSFVLKSKIFEKRKLTTLQHKLRVVLKCYTIREFILNDDNTFTFKKSYKINGLKFDDKKEICGSFREMAINEEEVRITISVF